MFVLYKVSRRFPFLYMYLLFHCGYYRILLPGKESSSVVSQVRSCDSGITSFCGFTFSNVVFSKRGGGGDILGFDGKFSLGTSI